VSGGWEEGFRDRATKIPSGVADLRPRETGSALGVRASAPGEGPAREKDEGLRVRRTTSRPKRSTVGTKEASLRAGDESAEARQPVAEKKGSPIGAGRSAVQPRQSSNQAG
jgi:hypothetical protein